MVASRLSNSSPALMRIPAARGQSTSVELRCQDAACNPYLALALCLAAGLDGIEKGLTPPEEITENIFAMDDETRVAHGIENLPSNLGEAVDALCADKLMCSTLGEHVFPRYVAGKRKEWEEYSRQVTDWEIKRYMTLL